MKALSLNELRSLLSLHSQREFLPLNCFQAAGIPKGAITEISGFGKTDFVAQIMQEHKGVRIAWVEENFSIFPFAFWQRDLDLHRILFIESGKQTEWVILQILKAQIFKIVVFYVENFELTALRRIQLASEKANVVSLWLTDKPHSLWPVSLQLQIVRNQYGTAPIILKQR
jgi:hypothetical protein